MSEKMVTGDHIFENRLYSLGRGICGVRLMDVQASDERRRIYLNADIDDFKNSKYFTISIQNLDLDDKTLMVALGETFPISLGDDGLKQLYDPNGELVVETEDSEYNISVVRMEHVGQWTLKTFSIYNPKPFSSNVTLKLKHGLSVDSWYMKDKGYGHVGCKLNNFPKKDIKYCQMLSPDNVLYTISLHTATERYTTVGTQLDQDDPICQIEFPLPATEQEIGTWKCTMLDYGNFIDVEQKTPQQHSNEQTQYIENDKLEISCSVPYLIEACHIESPSGRIFNIVDTKLTNGICFMDMDEVELGTWTCRISKPRTSENQIIKVHVKSISKEASISYDQVGARRNHPYNIMCNAEYPLNYCWFVSPSGKTYHATSEKNGKELVYFGRGLLHGDCGITIINVNDEHAGEWSCHMRKINENDELILKADVSVQVEDMDMVSSVGAPIGIALALCFFVGLIGYGLYKKRQYPSIDDQTEFRMDSTMHISNANNYTNNGTFD